MGTISKEDLDSEVVRAVIEHYRDANTEVRVASLPGALFVLARQAAKNYSEDALARIAAKRGLEQPDEQKEVWAVLERLIAAADGMDGSIEAEHRTAWDKAMADARALLAGHLPFDYPRK